MKLFTTLRQTLASFLGGTEKSVNQRYPHLSSPAVQVTPGEWFDRVTILEIKIEKLRGDKQQIAFSQYTRITDSPRGQELQYLRRDNATLKNAVAHLLSTNAKLWDIEDQIRSLDAEIFPLEQHGHINHGRGDDYPELTAELVKYLNLARSVYVTNDERSRWKREIDKFFEVQPEVKEYAHYAAKQ